jgi:TctA family transporter
MELALGMFFFLFIFLLWVIPMAFIVGSVVVWIIALVDVVKREFKQENDKTVWLIVILLCGGLGSFIYYFVVMQNPAKYTKQVTLQ